jgi:hypothetical protein
MQCCAVDVLLLNCYAACPLEIRVMLIKAIASYRQTCLGSLQNHANGLLEYKHKYIKCACTEIGTCDYAETTLQENA